MLLGKICKLACTLNSNISDIIKNNKDFTPISMNEAYFSSYLNCIYVIKNGLCSVTIEATPSQIPVGYVLGSICTGLPKPMQPTKVSLGTHVGCYTAMLDSDGSMGFYFCGLGENNRIDDVFTYSIAD